jgi:transcriptional regulator with XRE-family HTH domain
MSQKNLNSAEVNKFIGAKIVEARKSEGIKQQELADFLGISRIAMSSYETGRTRIAIPHLFYLSRALGKNLEYFLEGLFTETRKFKKKTKVIQYNQDKSVKETLELAIRNYLLKNGTDKANLSKKTDEILSIIQKKISIN